MANFVAEAASATGRRARIHTEIKEQPFLQVFNSFFCNGVRLGTESTVTFRIVRFFLCEAKKGAGD